MNRRRIYIDLDGVLVDLEYKLAQKFGENFKDLSADHIWTDIRDNEKNFFLNLEPYNDGWLFVENILDQYSETHYVAILTALPWPTGNLITADQDKRKWVRKYIHDEIPIHTLIGGVNKPEYLNNPGDILIDDTVKVVERWNKKGGVGILHKSYEESLIELARIIC